MLERGPRLCLDATAPRPLAPDVARAVEQRWTAACARRPGLFNGQVLSAIALTGDTLTVRAVEYRWFFAQREDASLRPFLEVQPIGVSGLVLTTDGCVLLGRRGADVTQYPGFWEAVPSGSLDGRAAVVADERGGGGTLDAEACLRAELHEEAGLAGADVGAVRAKALLFDDEERTYDVAYIVELTMPSAVLRQRLADESGREYDELVVLQPDEVDKRIGEAYVVPTTCTLWHLFRRSSAGGDT